MKGTNGTKGTNGQRAWRAVFVWLVFQLTLTTLPGGVLPPLPGFRIDWLAHWCLYFGLGFLVTRAWITSGRRAELLPLVWFAIAALGFLDEMHEQLVPGRGLEFMDWLMDTTGSGLGLLVGTFMMRARWAAKLVR